MEVIPNSTTGKGRLRNNNWFGDKITVIKRKKNRWWANAGRRPRGNIHLKGLSERSHFPGEPKIRDQKISSKDGENAIKNKREAALVHF